MSKLIKKLFDYADEQGLTQYEISKKSGLSEPTISKTRRNLSIPRIDIFEKMANAVGLKLRLGEKDE